MAAVGTFKVVTFNTTAGDKTATATPALNDLIVVVASSSGLAGGTTSVTDNNSSGTYTQVDIDRTGFSTTGVLTVWVRNALIGSAVSTIFTAAQNGSSGGGLAVYSFSGMTKTGTSAVRSSGGQDSQASGTPAPVLSLTPLTTNAIFTAMSHSTNGGTQVQPGSYTEGQDSSYNAPATGLESSFINSGITNATITYGGAAPSAFASVAIELDITGTAGITGTFVPSATEADVVAGGKTSIITLTGDTWIAAGAASFDLQRQAIINGVTSAQSEALGWNLKVKALQSLGGVVRTSNTVVTITWDAEALYDITANETITVTVPAAALVGNAAIVATPTFQVTPTAVAGTNNIFMTTNTRFFGS